MNFVVALLYAVAVSVLTGLGLALSHGGMTPADSAWALGLGSAVAAVTCWRRRKDPHRLSRPQGWEWVPVVLFALFSLRAFLWLVWWKGDELLVLSPNNLGDLSLHLTFIEYFRTGTPFWPDSPIFSGGKLAYAVGMDFFNTQLALVGLDTVRGLIWVGWAGAILSGLALWRWGGAFTLMGFLTIGGLAGIAAFSQQGEPFFQDYAGQEKFDWAWKNLPLALLVTQRGFLFALPAGLVLLTSWRSRYFGAGDGWRISFFGELLLYAAMPIFHIHTFLVLSFLLAVFFALQAEKRWKLTALVALALIPATILVWFTTGMGQANPLPMWGNMADLENPPPRPAARVLGWEPGWMVNEPLKPEGDVWQHFSRGHLAWLEPHGRFLCFWFGNFGAWPVIAALLALVLARQIARRPVPGSWLGWGTLAVVLVTPLLGQWEALSRDSFTQILFDRNLGLWGRYLFPGLLAAACGVLGWALWRRSVRWRPLSRALWVLAGLVALDGAWVAVHQTWPAVPIVPANVLPLLMITGAWLGVLWRAAQRWTPALWPAAFVLPALYLFFLCCHVKFAPWAWDNTKLMLWCVVILLPFLWELVIVRWSRETRALVCVLLFFTGTVSLLGGLGGKYHGYPIAQRSQLDTVRTKLAEIPATEVLACAPVWNHPLLLNGRRVVLGYTAHLGSHGLQYQGQERKLNALMNGADDWRMAAAELGVRYLWWGPDEDLQWPKSRQSWRKAVQLVIRTEWGDLYDLDLPRIPIEGAE